MSAHAVSGMVLSSDTGMTSNADQLSNIRFRLAKNEDLDALCEIENRSFEVDRLTRRAFKRFVGSETARLTVAETTEDGGVVVGYALVIFAAT